MLRTISGLAMNKLIFADSIDGVGGGKMIEKDSNTESGTEFSISRAKSTFFVLRHASVQL